MDTNACVISFKQYYAKVKSGKDAKKIFYCPKVQSAALYEPPETDNVAKVHIAEFIHNKASANCTHFARTNLACVLDIMNTVFNAIVANLFPNDEHANQASALEILQTLEKRFTTIRATNAIKIAAFFNAPYDTGATIDEYLHRQNDCIKKL